MSLLVCNLLIVITSIYRLLRTPPRLVEVGKSPIIPNISSQENSDSEPPSNNDTSRSERATAEEEEGRNVSDETGGGGRRRGGGGTSGNNSNDTGSYPKTATPSSTEGIELTEIYESDFSFA